jgi:hypothetical protein
MIRVICPGCQSKLSAKEELAGQTRKCPKCGAAVLISAPPPEQGERLTQESPSRMGGVEESVALPHPEIPERLTRHHRYFVCDRTRVIATWENNGQGWMIRAEHNFVGALRNVERLPNEGDFRLVEMCMTLDAERFQLRGLRVYQLARRWALVNLARGDDAILKSVTGPAALLREQKDAVRQHVKGQFTYDVWEDAQAIRHYLSNDDYHSSQVGED